MYGGSYLDIQWRSVFNVLFIFNKRYRHTAIFKLYNFSLWKVLVTYPEKSLSNIPVTWKSSKEKFSTHAWTNTLQCGYSFFNEMLLKDLVYHVSVAFNLKIHLSMLHVSHRVVIYPGLPEWQGRVHRGETQRAHQGEGQQLPRLHLLRWHPYDYQSPDFRAVCVCGGSLGELFPGSGHLVIFLFLSCVSVCRTLSEDRDATERRENPSCHVLSTFAKIFPPLDIPATLQRRSDLLFFKEKLNKFSAGRDPEKKHVGIFLKLKCHWKKVFRGF